MSSDYPCNLASPGCPDDGKRECLAQLDQVVTGLTREIDRLRIAIRTYLANPGCNINSRQTAMAKLRFAVEGK